MGKLSKLIGDEVKQILDMSDAARMQRAKEQGFEYARASQSDKSPINKGVGYAMFKKSDDPISEAEDLSRSYGSGKWVASGKGSVDVKDIQKDIIKTMRSRGITSEYGATGASIARTANPDDIVDSAGLWDNPDFVSAVWEDVIEPKGIRSIRTNDGLIVFDDSSDIVRSASAAFDPAKKDSGNLLAGALPVGAIGAASMLSPNESYAQTVNKQAMPRPDDVGSIKAPVHPRAAQMAGYFDKYNRAIEGTPLGLVLPEAPADWANKLAYDGKTRIKDRIIAALGML